MLKLLAVPLTLVEARAAKGSDADGTIDRVILDLNLARHLGDLDKGVRPTWKGIDTFAKAAADGGGPYRVILGKKVGEITVTLYGSVPDGKGAKPGAKVAAMAGARIKGQWMLHLSANMLTATSQISIVGKLTPEETAELRPYLGADMFADLQSTQTDAEEEAAEKAKASKKAKAADGKTDELFGGAA